MKHTPSVKKNLDRYIFRFVILGCVISITRLIFYIHYYVSFLCDEGSKALGNAESSIHGKEKKTLK